MRVITLLLAVSLILTAAQPPAAAVYPDWSDRTFRPLEISPPDPDPNPVLARGDISDLSAYFVADPFLFRHGEIWYMFFEVRTIMGEQMIALASSGDGLSWNYQRVVLEVEESDLSYPLVFKWGEYFYMTPSFYPDQVVRLYRADYETFPNHWEPVADILEGGEIWSDPTIFRYQGLWWMFVANSHSNTCWLFYSDELENPAAWVEHPASPIVVQDRHRARPGGRTLVLGGGRIIRFAQDCSSAYGEKLRAFEVDTLTTTRFHEFEIPESPILEPVEGGTWNSNRMHHCDPWWTGSHWLCSVDGMATYWAIGIYQSDEITGWIPPPSTADLQLHCHPNPCNPRTEISVYLPDGADATLTIHDCRGALVSTLVNGELGSGWWRFQWRGMDRNGEKMPSGVYLARLMAGGENLSTKLVLLK